MAVLCRLSKCRSFLAAKGWQRSGGRTNFRNHVNRGTEMTRKTGLMEIANNTVFLRAR